MTEFRPVTRRNRRRPVCLKCPNTTMERNFRDERCITFNTMYARECVDDTMGVHPDQVPEHRRRHPNIRLNAEGSILIGSHAERLAVGKELTKAFTES